MIWEWYALKFEFLLDKLHSYKISYLIIYMYDLKNLGRLLIDLYPSCLVRLFWLLCKLIFPCIPLSSTQTILVYSFAKGTVLSWMNRRVIFGFSKMFSLILCHCCSDFCWNTGVSNLEALVYLIHHIYILYVNSLEVIDFSDHFFSGI